MGRGKEPRRRFSYEDSTPGGERNFRENVSRGFGRVFQVYELLILISRINCGREVN